MEPLKGPTGDLPEIPLSDLIAETIKQALGKPKRLLKIVKLIPPSQLQSALEKLGIHVKKEYLSNPEALTKILISTYKLAKKQQATSQLPLPPVPRSLETRNLRKGPITRKVPAFADLRASQAPEVQLREALIHGKPEHVNQLLDHILSKGPLNPIVIVEALEIALNRKDEVTELLVERCVSHENLTDILKALARTDTPKANKFIRARFNIK